MFCVVGCGVLYFFVLIEMMCWEGYELFVGKFCVIIWKCDGVLEELFESFVVEVLFDCLGGVMELVGEWCGMS